MENYTSIYKQAAFSEHAISAGEIKPMQIIEFKYNKSEGPRRICLSLGYIPSTKMLHCFRLNGLPLNHFRLLMKNQVDKRLRQIYMKANKRGELIEALIVNKFKLPYKSVPYGELKSFYANNFKGNRYMTNNKIYRTYNLDDMSAVTVMMPNLEFLGLIPKTEKDKPTAEEIFNNQNKD